MASYIAVYAPIYETTFSNEEFDLLSGEVISFYSAFAMIPILVAALGASIWIIF